MSVGRDGRSASSCFVAVGLIYFCDLFFLDFIMGCNERNEYERGETKSN